MINEALIKLVMPMLKDFLGNIGMTPESVMQVGNDVRQFGERLSQQLDRIELNQIATLEALEKLHVGSVEIGPVSRDASARRAGISLVAGGGEQQR